MDLPMKMPDLATTGSEVKIVGWLAKPGEAIKRGQPLFEVETDKSTSEVESVVTGVLKELRIAAGESVSAGQVIAVFEVAGSVTTSTSEDSPTEARGHRQGASGYGVPPSGGGAVASTEILKPLEPLGVPNAPPAEAGTPYPEGPAGPEKTAPPATKPVAARGLFARNRAAAAQKGAHEVPPVTLSTVQRVIGRRMQASKQSVPHFYLQISANAEPMIARRQAAAPKKLVWDALFVSAVSRALNKFPHLRRHLENDELVLPDSERVGVAVDIRNELFVVGIDEPRAKSLEQISDEIRAIVDRLAAGDLGARALRPADITITNLGASGVESFAGIINPPEASILAVGKIAPQPVVHGGQIIVQNRVSLTLSVDHRIVNGKYAADFLAAIVSEIESM